VVFSLAFWDCVLGFPIFFFFFFFCFLFFFFFFFFFFCFFFFFFFFPVFFLFQVMSIPPTPLEENLPTKKRVVASDAPVEIILEFTNKDVDDRMMAWLIKNLHLRPVFLMCNKHPAGDSFPAEVPFWFDGLVSFNGEAETQVQFVKSAISHVESVGDDGKPFYSALSEHEFSRFTFVEHTGGLSFKCLLERNVKDVPMEEESEGGEELRMSRRGKREVRSKQMEKEQDNNKKKKKKESKKSKTKESSDKPSKSKKKRAKMDEDDQQNERKKNNNKKKNNNSNNNTINTINNIKAPVSPEEARRIVDELENKVRELCDDARRRINGAE
jgi:hypothetical protein